MDGRVVRSALHQHITTRPPRHYDTFGLAARSGAIRSTDGLFNFIRPSLYQTLESGRTHPSLYELDSSFLHDSEAVGLRLHEAK